MEQINGKELRFLYSSSKDVLVAARVQTGSTILFRQGYNDWDYSPRNIKQIEGDCIYNGDNFEYITLEEARNIFKDIYPDEKLLDKMDSRSNSVLS